MLSSVFLTSDTSFHIIDDDIITQSDLKINPLSVTIVVFDHPVICRCGSSENEYI